MQFIAASCSCSVKSRPIYCVSILNTSSVHCALVHTNIEKTTNVQTMPLLSRVSRCLSLCIVLCTLTHCYSFIAITTTDASILPSPMNSTHLGLVLVFAVASVCVVIVVCSNSCSRDELRQYVSQHREGRYMCRNNMRLDQQL